MLPPPYQHNFFPTLINSIFIDIELNPIINYLYLLKEKDQGVSKSNIGGWQSQDNLHTYPQFKNLCENIQLSFKKIKQKNPPQIEITSMWANISGKHQYNTIHSHGGYFPNQWSGCFYLKTFSDSGAFRVHNRTHPSEYVDLFPKPQEILLFNSDTHHSVLPNLSEEDRISIAFNFIEKE